MNIDLEKIRETRKELLEMQLNVIALYALNSDKTSSCKEQQNNAPPVLSYSLEKRLY